MGIRASRISCSALLLLLMLLVVLSFSLPPAYADGGAPQLAYVAGTAPGISIIDIAQRRVTGTIAVSGNPRTVLLSPDGQDLYVTQPTLGRVTVLIAKTGKTRCSVNLPGQPSLLALSLDYSVLYVAGQGDTSVRALDPTTCAVQHTFTTRSPIYGLAVAASTAANATPSTPNQLWITGDTSLTVFDATGNLLGTVPIDGGPQYISIPSGFTAYVTTRQGTVVAVDLNTRKVLRTLLSGGQFGPMDYDATTGEVYVPDGQHNLLDVLTPVTINTTVQPREPTRTLALSGSPQSIAITNDGQLGFVALSSGQVLMLDIPGRSVVTSIAVGGSPRFIITGLYPPVTSAPPPPTGQQQTRVPFPLQLLGLTLLLVAVILAGAAWFLWRRLRIRG